MRLLIKTIFLLTIACSLTLVAKAQDFTEESIAGGISTFASADFNDDGLQDLIGFEFIEEGPTNLFLMLNSSNDTIRFEELLLASSPLFNGTPAVGDFDGDEDMDIALSFSDAKMIVLLRNNGDNTFTQEDLGVGGVNRLTFQDLEGDGDVDLIGYTFDETEITAFINDGTGTLSPKTFEHQNDISFVDYGDIDEDGDVDVVLSVDKFSGETVAIYLNDSLNNFSKFTSADINALNSAIQVKIIDFNKDGKKDIVGLNDKKFTLFRQSDIFGFVPQDLIEPNNIGDFSRFEVADFNGDGSYDVVIGDFSDELRWYENNSLVFLQKPISNKQPINNLISSDFDNDGDIDFLAHDGGLVIYTNEIEQMSSSIQVAPLEILDVFPNPVLNSITIRSGQLSQLQILDMTGKQVYLTKLNSGLNQVHLSFLESGIYQLRNIDLKTKKQSLTRIIKL